MVQAVSPVSLFREATFRKFSVHAEKTLSHRPEETHRLGSQGLSTTLLSTGQYVTRFHVFLLMHRWCIHIELWSLSHMKGLPPSLLSSESQHFSPTLRSLNSKYKKAQMCEEHVLSEHKIEPFAVETWNKKYRVSSCLTLSWEQAQWVAQDSTTLCMSVRDHGRVISADSGGENPLQWGNQVKKYGRPVWRSATRLNEFP